MTNSCPKAVEQNVRPDMKMLTTARDKDVVTWHETFSSRAEGEDNDEDASVNDDEAVHVTDRMIMTVSLLGD